MEEKWGIWSFREIVKERGRAGLRRMLKGKRLFPVFNGIYANKEPDSLIVAAALRTLRPTAILEGASAIAVYEHRQPELPLRARVNTTNIGTGKPGLLTLRRSRLTRFETFAGRRVVTLLDAVAMCLEDGSVPEDTLRALVNSHYVSGKGVVRLDEDFRALGTRSRKRVREFVDQCVAGTDSGLERKTIRLLRKAGFIVEANRRVGGYKWDIKIRELKTVIDIDSERYHAGFGVKAFWIDRWKTNHAQLLGWTALRITDECVNQHWIEVLQVLNRIRAFRQQHPRRRLAVETQTPVWFWHWSVGAPMEDGFPPPPELFSGARGI